jgi:hypothetical protein
MNEREKKKDNILFFCLFDSKSDVRIKKSKLMVNRSHEKHQEKKLKIYTRLIDRTY